MILLISVIKNRTNEQTSSHRLTKGEEQDKKLSRNYASYECGAKVITSNPEAQGTSHVSLLNDLDSLMRKDSLIRKDFFN